LSSSVRRRSAALSHLVEALLNQSAPSMPQLRGRLLGAWASPRTSPSYRRAGSARHCCLPRWGRVLSSFSFFFFYCCTRPGRGEQAMFGSGCERQGAPPALGPATRTRHRPPRRRSVWTRSPVRGGVRGAAGDRRRAPWTPEPCQLTLWRPVPGRRRPRAAPTREESAPKCSRRPEREATRDRVRARAGANAPAGAPEEQTAASPGMRVQRRHHAATGLPT